MSVTTRSLLFAGLLFDAAILAAPQSLAANGQADAVVRSTTRLVQMNVIAQDKQGQPVTDLNKEDFQAFDNGKLCPVSVFVVESPGTASPLPPIRRDTFTNQFTRTTGARSAYAVVLLDWLNTGWSDQARARQQVIRMLRRIEPNDRIALYVLGQNLRVISDFGDDTARLLEKLAALRGDPQSRDGFPAAGIYDASVSTFDQGLFPSLAGTGRPANDSSKKEQMFFLGQRVRQTLAAFQEIAAHLTNVPGQKTLIWVSAGFPLTVLQSISDGALHDERNYNDKIEPVLQQLNNADVAVYPIDARGLTASPSAYDTIWTMKELAARTGGVAWYNRNDLDFGMRKDLDDIRFSYTLGFLPPAEAKPGFHRVQVKLRRIGVSLRYRDGYYLGELNNSSLEDRRTALARAMDSPVDSAAVPITVRAARSGDALRLHISLDAGKLSLHWEAGIWQGKLEIQELFSDAGGRWMGSAASNVVEIRMLPRTYDAALRDGLPFRITLPIPSHATTLKLLVSDVGSGKVGTLSIPLRQVTEN